MPDMTSRTRAQFERAFRRVLQGAGVIKPDPLPRRWPCIWDVKQSTLAELHEQRPLAPRSWSVFPFKRNERYRLPALADQFVNLDPSGDGAPTAPTAIVSRPSPHYAQQAG